MSNLNEAALSIWINWRNTSKHGPMSDVAVSRLKARLPRFGDYAAQQAAVDYSIRKGYQGVFAEGQQPEATGVDDSPLAVAMKRWASTRPMARVTVTPAMVANYRASLKGMTAQDFAKAVDWADKNCRFFPTPAELWQAARTVGWL